MTIENIMKHKLRMRRMISTWVPHRGTLTQIYNDMDQVKAMLG